MSSESKSGKFHGGGAIESATAPISYNPVTGVIVIPKADATHDGYLAQSDWSDFNNKLDASLGNYITNPDFESGVTGWNLYNDAGRTVPAFAIVNDLTYTAVASGDAGNGINVDYIFHATQPASTPLVTVLSPTHITVAWYNGPTLANNPTATQLKAAWDAVGGATALATVAITGTASNLQYITGSHLLGQGGDTAPVDGTGGSVVGVTFTQNTSTPLVGSASGDLGKDAANREGTGLSTDIVINTLDKGKQLQISFAYSGSSGMVLGSASDARIFLYDITNAVMIPVTPLSTITGPVSTAKTFVGVFTSASNSSSYRFIVHIATQSTTAWDLLLDSVTINDTINPTQASQVPSLVLKSQAISGAVTDHMCVMWRDGSTQWIPATITGAANPVFGSDTPQLGFATNIIGGVADIYIRGFMDGFSFGPFVGYEQYIDNIAGGISPLPSPFTDLYVMVGNAISSTALNIQFNVHKDLIANSVGAPIKGGLLGNSGVNDGTGDQVLAAPTNGNVLVGNTGATLGFNWAPAVVTAAPFTYTLATRTLTAANATTSVTGFLTSTDWNTFNGKLSSTLANGSIFIGNGSNVATAQAVSGDITITNAGVVTIGTNVVTNTKLAQMAADTVKGNNTGLLANAVDLTTTQLAALVALSLTPAQIQAVLGSGVAKITVGTVAPVGPAVGDLWVDTN